LASFRNFVRIPFVSLHCTSHAHPPASIANPLGLSYLPSNESSAWDMYLQQIDRVSPFLGDLSRWVDTLRRPKRVLIVDVPIHMDDGRITHFEGFRV
jgi:glutamate dehydrogenase (NAD(P)+)